MKTQSRLGTPGPPVTRAFHFTHPAPVLATVVVGLVLLTGGRTASAANYTITVNAAMQTAGNPRFWSAAVGTGTASLTLRADLQTHYKITNRELGMMRVRGHGVLNDDIGIYAGPNTYDWTKFDVYLNAIVSAGMRPFMELDFMPTALALNGSSRDSPRDINAYRQFIQAVVQHCVDKYGAADVGQWYWEVWNEPDYPGFWNGVNATEAVAAKMTDYYALYDAAVDGATAVLPNIFIGGPVTTEPSKIGAFLQHCRTANKRVTFASSHAYPGGNGTASANATTLTNDNNTRVAQITSGGYTTATVKSFNTEWNSAYTGQGGNPGPSNESMDSHVNAPFILKSVKLLSDRNQGDTPPVEVFSYWVASDIFDESGGPSGSYILGQGGNLPFGKVFGLMTFQGVRKAAFNAFKMLNYLGPKRLLSGGGVGGDGVDALATMSASDDELQIIVYDYFATATATATDNVTVTVSNLPAALAGKELFVTHFRVDASHSNPYAIWLSQSSPTNPSETQWQAMRHAQHLALLQPVSKVTVTSTYTTTFTLPQQGASLLILGLKRPLTGRNAFVEIEGEDYDGQTGVTKQDSNDTSLGQSIAGNSGSTVFFDNVDYSDAGAVAVQLRVAAQSATTLELRADSQTGPVMGTCAITATGGAWTTQMCELIQTIGVHNLFVGFGGTVRLNSLKFEPAPDVSGTGGAGGSGTTGGGGAGGGGAGGDGVIGGGSGGRQVIGPSSGGSSGAGTGGGFASGGGNPGLGGAPAVTGGGTRSGCSCRIGDAGGPLATLSTLGVAVAALGLRGRRKRRNR